MANPSGSHGGGASASRETSGQPRAGQQGAQSAQQTMSDMASRAQDRLEGLRDTANQFIEQGRERAGDYMEQGRDLAQQYIEQGRDRALEIERTLEGQIREQPLRAVLTAAGIGFVLGIFFMRR